MTVTFPDGIDAQGNGALWFLPAIAVLSAPKVSEFTAGVVLSCAIDAFSAPIDQSTVQDTRYCTTQQFETPGRVGVSIEPLNYVYDPQTPTATGTYKHYGILKQGVKGYLVNRLGIAVGTAPTAAQIVDVYPVTCGAQARQAIDPTAEGSKIKITQKFFVSGQVAWDAIIAA